MSWPNQNASANLQTDYEPSHVQPDTQGMVRGLYGYVICLCVLRISHLLALFQEIFTVSEDRQVDLEPHQVKTHPASLATTLTTTPCEPSVRLDTLHKACSRHDTQPLLKHYGHHFLYVNNEQKYVACLPLKAGCTTWKVILANNTIRTPLPSSFIGNSLHTDGLKPYKIYRLNSYSKNNQTRILENYYKFMVVRHPLDRLISGHNDKVLKGKSTTRNQIIKMRKRYHGDSAYDLSAFLEFILHQKYQMNAHWLPTTGLCDPCNVKYDKIVKLETQAEDLAEVLPHLGPYGRGKNVHRNHHGTGAASKFSWSRPELKSVNRDLLQKVIGIGYDLDMELFGYNFDNRSELNCRYGESNCC